MHFQMKDNCEQIRDIFTNLLNARIYTSVNREASMTNLMGNETIEIVDASFIADEPEIFGSVNPEYIQREEEWYRSMSLNVNDIPGGAPTVWKTVADPDGFINSNYGWCIFSKDNQYQYQHALEELIKNPQSRRAVMIYTRPKMWKDYNKNGRSDFMCTNTVQYLVRNNAVDAIVEMRSNDAWAGYRNDRAWQQHILEKLTTDLNSAVSAKTNYKVGKLYWHAGSLHVYARQFYLVDYYSKTGKISISKDEYRKLYPDSPYSN